MSKYDSYLYDNLIFMVPSGVQSLTKYSSLIIKDFLDFFDSPEKNIMIIADPAVFPFTRKFANEFGVDFDPQSSSVTNGTSFAILTTDLLPEDPSLFNKTKGIVYQGVGLQLDAKNPFVFPILKSSESDYSVNAKGEIVNEAPVLVAGYQGLNNNRVTITGSTMMCSNVQITRTATEPSHTSSPNYLFCEELVEWNFGESGILKADNILHKSKNEEMPTEYPIKTDIEYSIDLLQWDKKKGQWHSFNNADAQLEFVMIDPYYRIPLSQSKAGQPTYRGALRTPDRLGAVSYTHLTLPTNREV
eukprot:TRINITY_DN9125_c0_g2_i8.p2 TRINITY_DN9125_c0_g2~~TRINITY_DN9125_c0_g2_i8.p2  ORF type:complete len:302 (-),score=90.73 TRINITY_DN9125_c0_g2_i8:41-946(-)